MTWYKADREFLQFRKDIRAKFVYLSVVVAFVDTMPVCSRWQHDDVNSVLAYCSLWLSRNGVRVDNDNEDMAVKFLSFKC